MPYTPEFQKLKSRLRELKINMLPKKFSPTGDYNNRIQDRARGYRLLVHAEIEAYLEDVSRIVVNKKINEWKKNRIPSRILISFIACYHSGWVEYDEVHNEEITKLAKSRKNIKEIIEEVIDHAQQQYMNNIMTNHGVRKNNLKKIIIPLGIDMTDLDQTWLNDLDDFGKKRGDLAHKSKSTQSSIDPKVEYNRISNILEGLKELDKKIYEIL